MTIMDIISQYGWIPTFILLIGIGFWIGKITERLSIAIETLNKTVSRLDEGAESDAKFKLEVEKKFSAIYNYINDTKESIKNYVQEEIRQHKSECK